MPENLKKAAVIIGLEKVSFHSKPKERQCQRMFKLLHNCTQITHWQSNAQNSPSKASTVCELRTSRCSSWIQKKQRNQRSNCHHPLNHRNAKEFQKNIYFCFIGYAKDFDRVVTHLESHNLECEVKWALASIIMIKASEGDGIPVELLQILKNDAIKVLHSICQQIWNTQQWPQDQKRSVFISIPKKGNAKECSKFHTVVLITHAGKVMLKILQARLQQYMN